MKIALRFPLSSKIVPLFAVATSIALSGCGTEKFATNGNATSPTGTSSDGNAASNAASTRDAQSAEEPPSKLGKYGGSLTDATISDPKTFNLWVAAETSSTDAVGNLFDALLARNPYTQQWEGHLAELPEVSADNLTYTFKLKPGLKWSDGAPLTADDVTFTLDVVSDDDVQTNMRESMLLDAPDGKGGFKRVPLIYKKIDASTVQFTFPAPYAPAREILSFPIAPRHKLYKAWKSKQFNSTWGVNADVRDIVSSGPVVLDSYVPGQRLVYKRNPNYWKKDAKGRPLPYLDRFVSLIVPDVNTLMLKFRARETDVLTSIQHTDFPSIKKGAAQGNYATFDLGPSFGTNYISFNMNPKSQVAQQKPWLVKTFRDTRFRQAVAFGINRKRIIDQVFLGLATPLYGPETSANKQFYNDQVSKYLYDPAKAKALLAQMGLKDSNGNGILEMDGHDIKFNILTNVENNQRKTMAAIIADSLRQIGLGAIFTPINFNAMVAKLDAKPETGKPYPPYDWEAVVLSFTGSIEPHNGRSIWTSSGNLHQWYPYQDKPDMKWEAEIDTIFREGAQEMDESKRKAMYDRWQQLVAEQQPLVYTVTPNVLAAVRNKYGNVKASNTAGLTWNTEEWFARDATRNAP